MAQKKKIRLIIFDLDGTLVDSREDIVDAVNYTLKKHGLKEKKPAEIISYVGTGTQDLIRKSLDGANGTLFNKALLTFNKYNMEHCADKSAPYPHVKEILEYFGDKKKAVVTNRNHDSAVRLLSALGIKDYFDLVVGGDRVDCMKPSSCPLDMMINKLDADKSEVIMIGDMKIDILAGKEAGILTCAVTYGIGKRADIAKAKPDFIIDDIVALKNIIK